MDNKGNAVFWFRSSLPQAAPRLVYMLTNTEA